MILPMRMPALLIPALLAACIILRLGLDPAAAGANVSPAKTAAATDTASANRPGSVQAVAPALLPQVAPPVAAGPRGRAYLFRGAMGPIFSRGMDRLTDLLTQEGITAEVYEFTICRWIAEGAIRDYRADPQPIILIGHSMGGYCAIKFAQMLQDENIPASLVVTIDPAHITPEVPLNVERFITIFLSKDVLGGGDVKPSKGYQGHYASYDLSEHDEVSHITIEKMADMHRQLVEKVLQLSSTPAKSDVAPLPLRYVVPPHVAIELWDSGAPLIARPGDTLQAIADLYHLPLWSLAEVNKGPLVPGERIVVPRHLVPLAEPAEQPVSAR